MRGPLIRVALRGFQAAAEALYPTNDGGAPDWRETDMVARAEQWLRALPPEPRRLIVALFAALELGGPLLVPAFGLLSRVPLAARVALIRRWRASHLAPLKFLGDAIKSATSMIYLSHPAALRYVGMYEACGHPSADLGGPVRDDALAPRGETP